MITSLIITNFYKIPKKLHTIDKIMIMTINKLASTFFLKRYAINNVMTNGKNFGIMASKKLCRVTVPPSTTSQLNTNDIETV